MVKGSDQLFIEAFFLDEDKDRARDRFHLTAREAGRIAREADVRKLEVFHFSPKYTDVPEKLIAEAKEEFKGGSNE
jgi:ribonuclease Z